MDNATYLALAKQITSFDKLNVTANNVANAGTDGFKKDQLVFEKYIPHDVNDKISFPDDKRTVIDLSEGSLKPTSRALDVAIMGSGFFIVKTQHGISYTRNGNFHIDTNGMLVDSKGNPVLSDGHQEIHLPEGISAPTINSSGVMMLEDGTEIGQVGVVDFDDYKQLKKAGYGNFLSDGSEIVKENPQVVQGMLEESNVNSVQEMVQLADLQKDVSMSSSFINDLYNMQKSAYKVYTKIKE